MLIEGYDLDRRFESGELCHELGDARWITCYEKAEGACAN